MINNMVDQMRKFRSGSTLKVANGATDNNTLAAAIIGTDTNYPISPPQIGTASNGSSSTTVAVSLRTSVTLLAGQLISFVKSDFSSALDRTISAVTSAASIVVNTAADLSSGTWYIYRRGIAYGTHVKVMAMTVSTPVSGLARFYSGIGNALPATFTKIGEFYMPATSLNSSGNKYDLVGIAGAPIFCVFTADAAVSLAGAIDAALNVEGRWMADVDAPHARS